MTDVDVVIVSYNSGRTLRSCVGPLTGISWISVVVVDNASPENGLDSIADFDASVIRSDTNRGFATACNIGWHSGCSPYVLFLNPDASIAPSHIERLIKDAQLPGVGAAAPRIVKREGSLAYSLRRFPRLRSTYGQAFFLHRLFPRASWADDVVRDPDAYSQGSKPEWVSGACILVTREALTKIGGWDDGFFLYCEDTDLCLRLRAAGYSVVFDPEAICLHEEGASGPRAAALPILAASRVHLARKHRGWLIALAEACGVALGGLSHAVLGAGDAAVRRGHARSIASAMKAVGWPRKSRLAIASSSTQRDVSSGPTNQMGS